MKIDVPTDISGATGRLSALEGLITAQKWERAAIVRAFAQEGKPGPQAVTTEKHRISFTEFAALGIVGLTNRQTVARYWEAWSISGKPEPKPGQAVELPSCDFPRTDNGPKGSVTHHPEWNSESWWSIIDDRRQKERKQAEEAGEPVPDPGESRFVAAIRMAIHDLVIYPDKFLLKAEDLPALAALIPELRGAIAEVRAARARHTERQTERAA